MTDLAVAQESSFNICFQNAHDLVSRVFDQVRVKADEVPGTKDMPPESVADMSYSELVIYYKEALNNSDVPRQAIRLHSENLASRTHLLRAFADPESAIDSIKTKVMRVMETFPKEGSDIEVGRNKGDVLDPFILAANQYLLQKGDFDAAIGSTVSHKALMIIEGLLGHLHEDVIGMMRGNVRVPEPRGEDQEKFDYGSNPFPGSDVVQPPLRKGDKVKFHQIKSKTGSAKGGDGKRLGEQLKFLKEHYDGEIYYHALVGNTLIGHRSKAGVEKVAPGVVVLVGEASFRVLTGSAIGPQLLLRLYQEAFLAAADETNYSIESVTTVIAEYFRQEAKEHGDGYLETVLSRATHGAPESQDNRLFNELRRQRKKG